MQELPLESTPNQEFLVTLEDQDCTIALYQRGERIYLDLSVDSAPVRQGAVCMPGMGIIQGAESGFVGQLYIIDERSIPNRQRPPQWEGLGTRWRLYYLTVEEMDALEAARLEAALNG